MKNLYIDCSMGAAGDMLMAALLELLSDAEKETFFDKMNGLGLPGVEITAEKKETCGIGGTHMHVTVNGVEEGHEHHHDHHHDHEHHHHHDHDHEHHHHNSYMDIQALISGLDLSENVKTRALQVYGFIAEAESQVHGKDMENIHFHEVGTMDAVADVVGNCLLMEMLGSPRVTASPVHVGSGTVKCAHGVLPVPAPATALILSGIPIYGGDIKGELCTPTGAALLKHFAAEFGSMPPMTVEKIGYGVGTKEFSQANCVRILLGETYGSKKDEVIELAANIDDMTAEEIGFAMEILMEKGALDVYAEPITMKKSRPAVKLVCMCRPENRDEFTKLMFKHTTSIGIREYHCARTVQERHTETAETPWGNVAVKVSSGNGVSRTKAEFEDLARIAREQDRSILEIKKEING